MDREAAAYPGRVTLAEIGSRVVQIEVSEITHASAS